MGIEWVSIVMEDTGILQKLDGLCGFFENGKFQSWMILKKGYPYFRRFFRKP